MTRRYVVKIIWCPKIKRPHKMTECLDCEHYGGHDLTLDNWVDCNHIRPRRGKG